MTPVVVTLLYQNSRVLAETYKRYLATTAPDGLGAHHIFVDQHYPNRYDEVRSMAEAIVGKLPRSRIVDPGKNLGLHEGFNFAAKQLDLWPDDIIVGLDGDELLETPGWLDAMIAVFRADPAVGWVSLCSDAVDEEAAQRGHAKSPIVSVGGYRCYEFTEPMINHVTGFRWSSIQRAGGFYEARPYYGGLESDLTPRFKNNGHRILHMCDFRVLNPDALNLQDPDYQEYKRCHVGMSRTNPQFDGSFDEWLQIYRAGGAPAP